jgi:co-chaperonin GroES (HSP10)
MATLLLPKHAKQEYIASKNRVTTMRGEYEKGGFKGNTSGRKALGDAVLIQPDQHAEKTAVGIHYTDEFRERSALAAETGVIVDVGEDAFRWNSDRTRAWEGYKPQPGDRVIFGRYQYIQVPGDDGVTYWAIRDSSICAIERK